MFRRDKEAGIHRSTSKSANKERVSFIYFLTWCNSYLLRKRVIICFFYFPIETGSQGQEMKGAARRKPSVSRPAIQYLFLYSSYL